MYCRVDYSFRMFGMFGFSLLFYLGYDCSYHIVCESFYINVVIFFMKNA